MVRIDNIISFLIGGTMGAIGASVVLKDKYKNKYKKQAEEQLASMQEYVDKLREMDKTGELVQNKEFMGEEVAENDPSRMPRKAPRSDSDAPTNYAAVYSGQASVKAVEAAAAAFKGALETENEMAEMESPKEDDGDSEESESWDDAQMNKHNKNVRDEPPFIISPDEYDELQWHDKMVLIYYIQDRLLVSEHDNEPIMDVDLLVGDCLERSGFMDNDDSEIFIRNLRIGCDYDVVKDYGNYNHI